MYLGDVCMRERSYAEARGHYEVARDKSPENATFHAKLSMVDAALGCFDSALIHLENARELDENKIAVVQAGKFYEDQNRALLNKQAAAQGKPEFVNPMRGYGSVMHGMTQDRDFGQKLDKYMHQSAFVLRENRKWLTEACLAVPSAARALFLDIA
jgi:tetratricopeptide (TPR) repeat protein